MLSIGEWALPLDSDIASRLAVAVAGGFDGVELVWCDEGSMLAGSSPASVAAAARRAGTAITSVCTEPLTISHRGGGTCADSVGAMLEAAVLLGAEVVVLNLGRLRAGHARQVVEAARRAGELGGVAVALENGLPGDLLIDPHTLAEVADVGPTPVDVHLDVGNATATATLDPWLTQARHPLRSLHLKDWSTASGFPRACGEGDVDWHSLWEQLAGRFPSLVTIEHSRRALGSESLSPGLADRVRTWLASGQMRGARR